MTDKVAKASSKRAPHQGALDRAQERVRAHNERMQALSRVEANQARRDYGLYSGQCWEGRHRKYDTNHGCCPCSCHKGR